MLETIFALMAAVITMIVSGLLAQKQNESREKIKAYKEENVEKMEDIIYEVKILTGKEAPECSIQYLEERIKMLNNTIGVIRTQKYKRRDKNVERKKDITDD